MLSAARHVMQFGGVAVSPTSGSIMRASHLPTDSIRSTAVMTAVVALSESDAVRTAGILDYDEH